MEKTRVYFFASSRDTDVASLCHALGIPTTDSQRIGDLRPTGLRAKTNAVSIASPLGPEALITEHVAALVKRLQPFEKELKELPAFEKGIMVVCEDVLHTLGFSLSQEVISFLHSLDAVIVFDMYLTHAAPDNDDSE